MGKGQPRDKGEGAIYQRASDGLWVGAIEVSMPGEARKRRTFSNKDREVVVAWLRRALFEKQQGLLIGTDRQTVAQFLQYWLDEVIVHQVRTTTLRLYALRVCNHYIPAIGRLPLGKLTPQHIQSMISRWLKEGLAASTIKVTLSTLSMALQQAVDWDLIPKNPVDKVRPPRPPEKAAKPILAPAQIQRLLESARPNRMYAALVVSIYLGLRRGEVLGLRWVDISFDAMTLQVKRGVVLVDGQLKLGELKTRSSARMLPMPAVVADALAEHYDRQARERAVAGVRWAEQGLVFPTSEGAIYRPSNYYKVFQQELAAAGLPLMPLHALRHTNASMLAIAEVQPGVMRDLLGHSDTSTTLDYYTHTLDETKRQAVERLEALLRPDRDETAT